MTGTVGTKTYGIFAQSSSVKMNSFFSKIYDTIDLHFLRLKRQKDYLDPSYQNTSWSWQTYQKLELNYANQAEATVVVTEDEKQVLSSFPARK